MSIENRKLKYYSAKFNFDSEMSSLFFFFISITACLLMSDLFLLWRARVCVHNATMPNGARQHTNTYMFIGDRTSCAVWLCAYRRCLNIILLFRVYNLFIVYINIYTHAALYDVLCEIGHLVWRLSCHILTQKQENCMFLTFGEFIFLNDK